MMTASLMTTACLLASLAAASAFSPVASSSHTMGRVGFVGGTFAEDENMCECNRRRAPDTALVIQPYEVRTV